MNTFIFLGCVPVPEWQHKINFVAKTVLDKKNTYILVRKKKIYSPLKGRHLGFLEWKKWQSLGGEFAVNSAVKISKTQKSSSIFGVFFFCLGGGIKKSPGFSMPLFFSRMKFLESESE